MFVKTVKVKKPNPLALGIILIIALVIIAVWVLGESSKGIGNKYKLTTNEERIAFLEDKGWDVSEQETDVKVVKIPETFNMVYQAYNKLQKQQGFDLSSHKGATVEIYTYDVYNYPDKPKNIVVHLIIEDGVLIGGDVCCSELDGFMHGLMPVKNQEEEESIETTGTENTEQQHPDAEDANQSAGADPITTGAIVIEQAP